ncbi:DUF2341 domain-containing protein [Candidatus Woesearchaeota archaeon]|nr:DUF2341 domain-containing protein [Candidatus Woesearchaeota archaeon]MCF7900895.1 DUF2341 domain-containing protein [Candidatus Woesearchaeota archaeon]MCF8013056.1 DUF2341 domain-containing protein [Candidatus Woesearchaeota archaeon]
MLILLTSNATADWWNPAWEERINLSMNYTGNNQTNFPIAVHLNQTIINYNKTMANGQDIRMIDCQTNQSLNYEIELWNNTGDSLIWVNIPTISPNSCIWLYYNNSQATTNQSAANTWNSNYDIVYHMTNTGIDVSGNNINYNGLIGSPQTTKEFLGYGQTFDGTNAWNMKDVSYWEIEWYVRAHEVVFKTTNDITTKQTLLGEGGGTNGVLMYIDSGNLYARWWSETAPAWAGDQILAPIEENKTYYAIMTFAEDTAPNNYSLILNGVTIDSRVTPDEMDPHTGDGGIAYTGTNTKDYHDGNSGGNYFKGTIYEFRTTNSIYDEDWYALQNKSIFNNLINYNIESGQANFNTINISDTTLNYNQTINITANITSTEQINKTWLEIIMPDTTKITKFLTKISQDTYELIIQLTNPGIYTLELFANNSQGNNYSTTLQNIELYNNIKITNISTTNTSIDLGNSVKINCTIINNDTNSPLENYTVTYTSNQTGFLENKTTNNNGIAQYTFIDNTLGIEEITCHINNSQGKYLNTINPSSMQTTIITIQPSDLTIYNVTHTELEGIYQNIKINTNIKTAFNITYAKINITLPNNEIKTINMTHITGELYEANYNDTKITGNYKFKIYAQDEEPSTDISPEFSFDIEVNSNIEIYTDKEAYAKNEIILLSSNPLNWWDINWNNRKEITLTENSNENLYEYQVPINVNTQELITQGKLSSDCSDIRMISIDNEELDFFYEEYGPNKCNTTQTTIWTKMPIMLANEETTIYIYYNNIGIEKTSNISNTFSYNAPRTIGYVLSDVLAAQSLSVISLEDDNEVQVNATTKQLNKQNTTTFPASSINTQIKAKKAVHITSQGDGTDIISPISHAGTNFYYRSDRYTNRFAMISPFGNANVTIYSSGTKVWNGIINENGSVINQDIVDGNTVKINSTLPILVQHISDSGSADTDSQLFYPATTDPLYGVPTNYLQIGSGANGAYTIFAISDGTTGSASMTNNQNYESASLGTQGTAPAYKLTSNKPIGANSQADSDGVETNTFWPYKELGYTFGANEIVQYIAIAAPEPNTTCTVYNSAGTQVDQKTGGQRTDINKIIFGLVTTGDHTWQNAGWLMECNKPVYAHYEKESGASSEPTDETQLMSHKQIRQYIYPEPTYTINTEKSPIITGLLNNTGETNITGYLILTIEKYENETWNTIYTVLNNSQSQTKTTLEPTQTIDIASYWNSQNGWNSTENQGTNFRAAAYLVNLDQKILTNQNTSQILATHNFKLDKDPPIITLISPNNKTGDNDGIFQIKYSVSDNSEINLCEIYLNSGLYSSRNTITKDSTIVKNTNLNPGKYSWFVSCIDEAENIGYSETRSITVLKTTNYDGETTDLTNADITNIPNFKIHKSGIGKIIFQENVDLSQGGDLNNLIQIQNNKITINTNSFPQLNKSATLTLYDLNLQNPIILRDGIACDDCTINTYASNNLEFAVPHFTSYSATENSELIIWDDTDTKRKTENEKIYFYANYTNRTSSQPITGIICTINVNGTSDSMTYNAGTYTYNKTFTQANIYNYTINCDGSPQGYSELNATDYASINAMNGPLGANVTTINSERYNITTTTTQILSQAANVTKLTINASAVTSSWQGYFGNITGKLKLENSNGETFYDWNLINPSGEIYATRAFDVNFATINCADITDITNEENFLNQDPSNSDSVTNTYHKNNHPEFYVGQKQILQNACKSTNIKINNQTQEVNSHQILLSDAANNIIYTSTINTTAAFNNNTFDFQLIVGEPGKYDQTTTPYYFFIEIN